MPELPALVPIAESKVYADTKIAPQIGRKPIPESTNIMSQTAESSEESTEDDMENFFMNEEDHFDQKAKPKPAGLPSASSLTKRKTARNFVAGLFPKTELNKEASKELQVRMQLQKMDRNRKKGTNVFEKTDIHVIASLSTAELNLSTSLKTDRSGKWLPSHTKTIFNAKEGKWYDIETKRTQRKDSLGALSSPSEELPEGYESHGLFTTHLTERKAPDDDSSWFQRWYNKLLYWYANNSASLTIQRLYERVLFIFNLYSDVQVLLTLIAAKEPIWAMMSWSSLAAPYVACWTAGLDIVYDKAESQYMNQNFATIFKALYVFPLFGISLLLLFDLFLIILYLVINPLRVICKYKMYGVNRDVSNYLALRAITGLFLTDVIQVTLQVYIFLSDNKGLLELEDTEVFMAVGSSVISIMYMFYKLKGEAYLYGEGLFDYTLLTLQGRFNFMPFLRDIAHGTLDEVVYAEDESGDTGNYLRFGEKQLITLVGSINSKRCELNALVLGHTCENVNMDMSDILWQLSDMCALKYIKFNEAVTQEAIRKDRDKILRIACEKEYAGLVSKLIYLKPPVDLNSSDEDTGMTPLMYACETGSYAVARRLMDVELTRKKCKDLLKLNLRCKRKRTAIMYCLGCHKSTTARVITINMDVLKLLLTYAEEAGRNIDLNNQDAWGRTIVSYLAERGGQQAHQALKLVFAGDKKLLKLETELVKEGKELLNYSRINITIADNTKMTPLMYACRKGNMKMVKLLMRHKSKEGSYSITGYQVDILGRHALHYAVLENRDKVVQYLLSKPNRKPDINLGSDSSDGGCTPLIFAVIWEHNSITKLLLSEKNIRVNARDVKNRTAFIRGCRAGSANGVRFLLRHSSKLDVLARDKFNKGAWDYAYTADVRAVLACNIKNLVFVESFLLSEGENESPMFLKEKVMAHTNINDRFTLTMLLKAFDNNPDLANAAYDRVVRPGGDLQQLNEVVMQSLRGNAQPHFGLLASRLATRPLNNTYKKTKTIKLLGQVRSDSSMRPILRQESRSAWL